jgi:hypothetical protein
MCNIVLTSHYRKALEEPYKADRRDLRQLRSHSTSGGIDANAEEAAIVLPTKVQARRS